MEKNTKSLRYILSLFIVLLFAPTTYSFLETIEKYPGTTLGVVVGAGVLLDEMDQALKDSRAFQLESLKAARNVDQLISRIESNINETTIKHDVTEKNLIKLINREIVFGKYPVELFPTIKSKIFVLQNIEDFFSFDLKELSQEHKAIRTIQINALEESLKSKSENILHNWINNELEYFKSQYNLSSSNLKDMTQKEVENKIKLIKQNLQQLIAKNDINDRERSFIDISQNGSCRALLALLAHLIYKQANQTIAQQPKESQNFPNTSQQSLLSQLWAWLKRFGRGANTQ